MNDPKYLTESINSNNIEDIVNFMKDNDLILNRALPDGDINDFNIPIITNVNIDGQCINLDSNGIFLDNQSINLDFHRVVLENQSFYLVKPLSMMNDNEFINSIETIIQQMKNGEYQYYKFLSDLSIHQRNLIHTLCEKNGIPHVTTGTRYRVLTIGKE
ncbi:unnamed protein product [Brachionus calyciflorus]|uniref:R3H domain-containing protein n=1 Tax=Brachionus calyciflorus TaxID=104777 RepID=A0A814AHN6_9BILA|nr:unnamed protein product [Brachionus calyciflorus]